MDKRSFLRGISEGIQNSDERPMQAAFLLWAGLFILVIIAIYIIQLKRMHLKHLWIRLKKQFQGAFVTTNRYRLKTEVTLELPGYDSELLRTSTTNMSSHGMFVKLNPPAQMGERLRFHLFLETGLTISGDGEVRWVQDGWSEHHPTGIGIKFLNIPAEQENRLRLWIQKKKLKRAA